MDGFKYIFDDAENKYSETGAILENFIEYYNDKIFMDIHDILQSSEHKEKAAKVISNNPFITKLNKKITEIYNKSSTTPPNLNKLSKESNHTMILPYTDVIYMYFLNLLMCIYQLKNN